MKQKKHERKDRIHRSMCKLNGTFVPIVYQLNSSIYRRIKNLSTNDIVNYIHHYIFGRQFDIIFSFYHTERKITWASRKRNATCIAT